MADISSIAPISTGGASTGTSKSVHDLKDLPPHFMKEVEHFFLTYKDLEEKDVHTDGWEGRDAALAFVKQCVEAYQG